MQTVYLFSYPRSGNSMIASMMLAAFPGMTFRSVYEGEDDAPRFLEELATVGVVPSENPQWEIVKTHHWMPEMVTSKVIWLIRDGRDAMYSYWHHSDKTKFRNPLEFWMSLRGEPLDGIASRWDQHVNAVEALNCGHLPIYYETVKRRQELILKLIGNYLSLTPSVGNISKVSFENLNAINPSFYRQGQVNNYMELPTHMIDYLDTEMGPTLKKFGY